MGIKSEQDPRFKDLISLRIKENANINYTNLRQVVKTINDVEKITEQNIGEFLDIDQDDIDQDVPQENYHYIVNNFKEIITKHLKYYPERKSFLS